MNRFLAMELLQHLDNTDFAFCSLSGTVVQSELMYDVSQSFHDIDHTHEFTGLKMYNMNSLGRQNKIL